ncbi:hypothetical protein JCM3765_002685 [Sporobolomyces pararoseus]
MSPPTPSLLRSLYLPSLVRSLYRPSSSPLPRSLPSTSPSTQIRPSSSTSHILHPTTRQRLTNLTFYLCAFVSIATVSLTMSGSIGDGRSLPCPARTRVGAGLEEERPSATGGKGKSNGSSRWLEDPVGAEKETEVWRAGKDGKLYKVETTGKDTGKQADTGRIEQIESRSEARRSGGEGKWNSQNGIAWRDWVGLSCNSKGTGTNSNERVV